jgi:hypothetical protein
LLGDHWLPASSKLVVVAELEGRRIAIHVDPGVPNAWRQQPFYSEIKEWSLRAIENKSQVMVCIGKRSIVVFPDREVDLGVVANDERIIISESRTATGITLEARKLKADDPRVAGLEPGKPLTIEGKR